MATRHFKEPQSGKLKGNFLKNLKNSNNKNLNNFLKRTFENSYNENLKKKKSESKKNSEIFYFENWDFHDEKTQISPNKNTNFLKEKNLK